MFDLFRLDMAMSAYWIRGHEFLSNNQSTHWLRSSRHWLVAAIRHLALGYLDYHDYNDYNEIKCSLDVNET